MSLEEQIHLAASNEEAGDMQVNTALERRTKGVSPKRLVRVV